MKDQCIELRKVKEGMVVSRPVHDIQGRLLVPAGYTMTHKALMLLSVNAVKEVYIQLPQPEVVPEVNAENSRMAHIRESSTFKSFDRVHRKTVGIVKDTLNNMLTQSEKINPSKLIEEMNAILHTSQNTIQVFDMLHCIRNYDDSTYVHCVNVALICNVMGKWCGYSKEDTEVLTLAGLLHDTGKLMIPPEIIKKPGKLTDAEFAVIKTHPFIGYQLLQDEDLDERIKKAVLEHHEKCDGSGYPNGLKDNEIGDFSKIVTIADVYDAMTANRVYRSGVCPFDVINIFEAQGFGQYDVKDLLIFLEHIVESYINKEVLLSDGSQAKVIMINKHRLAKPVVQVRNQYIDLSRQSALDIKAVL